MIKLEVFKWIKDGLKTIEIRKGKAFRGSQIVFIAGVRRGEMVTLKAKILDKKEGSLAELLTESNFKRAIPIAESLNEAIAYVQNIYPNETMFTSYYFEK